MRLKHVFLTNWEIEITPLIKVIDSHMVALVRIRNSCHFKDKTWDLTKSMCFKDEVDQWSGRMRPTVERRKGWALPESRKWLLGRDSRRREVPERYIFISNRDLQGARYQTLNLSKKYRDYSFWAKKLRQKNAYFATFANLQQKCVNTRHLKNGIRITYKLHKYYTKYITFCVVF